jgi:hypothetical protein
MAATSFPQFTGLPPEIRQMIWQATAVPRIVYLELVENDNHPYSQVSSVTSIDGPEGVAFFEPDPQSEAARLSQGPGPVLSFRSQSIPTLFLICKESYLVAEKLYTKSFGTEDTLPSTWFNFELDTLYLDWGCSFEDENDHEIGDVIFNFFPR